MVVITIATATKITTTIRIVIFESEWECIQQCCANWKHCKYSKKHWKSNVNLWQADKRGPGIDTQDYRVTNPASGTGREFRRHNHSATLP